MKKLTAASADELLSELSKINITVPLRGQGRTKEHAERWPLARFLSTYARAHLITYPLNVIARDRPDAHLSMPSADIGMEITEAVPEDWAKITALRIARGYENSILLPRFRPDDAPRPPEEIERIARGEYKGSCWGGDSVEQTWADVIIHFSRRKAEKLSGIGFQRFPTEWLLVYDGWPLPALDEDRAAACFVERLTTFTDNPFESIFVEGNKHFWHFRSGSDHCSTPINEIWKNG